MANLTITDERVRKAAETCPDAKRVLTELFPEAFAPKTTYVIHFDDICNVYLTTRDKPELKSAAAIQGRNCGDYHGKGFYLPKAINGNVIKWKVVVDSAGENVLLGEVNS